MINSDDTCFVIYKKLGQTARIKCEIKASDDEGGPEFVIIIDKKTKLFLKSAKILKYQLTKVIMLKKYLMQMVLFLILMA